MEHRKLPTPHQGTSRHPQRWRYAIYIQPPSLTLTLWPPSPTPPFCGVHRPIVASKGVDPKFRFPVIYRRRWQLYFITNAECVSPRWPRASGRWLWSLWTEHERVNK
ncbi:hypothetical protein PTI98_005264 [Pleurotus ostreatus]|nr:hypothetical protein PTI98_005264 [Pleurotus ostreatus]